MRSRRSRSEATLARRSMRRVAIARQNVLCVAQLIFHLCFAVSRNRISDFRPSGHGAELLDIECGGT